MRRILWCIISLCLILLSLALLLRFRDDADPLPAPLENVVSHVEGLLSLSPEHAVDEFKQDEEEEVQKEDGEEIISYMEAGHRDTAGRNTTLISLPFLRVERTG